jgi:hypothetical protein
MATAAPAPRWWERAWLPGLVLLLGLTRQLWVNLRWVEADGRVGLPVHTGMAQWLSETIALHGSGQLWTQRVSGFEPIDLHSLLGLAGWLGLGPDTDAPQVTVLLCLVGAQLLLFDAGRRLGWAWGGLGAALLLGVMPEASAMARCWAPQVPQMLLLSAALDCLLASRSFTRPLPVAGFVTVAIAGCAFSPSSTDDLLFALALLGMAGASWSRGLAARQGPSGQAVSRTRVLAAGLVAAGLVLAGAWLLHFQHMGLSYFASEAGSRAYRGALAWWHPALLSAYPRWLLWHGLGPWLAVSVLVGLILYAGRGAGRAELLGWTLLPLLVLGVLYKKNPYYIAGIYPALALGAALGLARLRWPGLLALGALLGGAWWQWEVASRAVTGPQPTGRMADMHGVFQTANPPDLHPWSQDTTARERAFLEPRLGGSQCPIIRSVCTLPVQDEAALVLTLQQADPCLRWWPEGSPGSPDCELTLSRQARGEEGPTVNGKERVAEDRSRYPWLSLWR